ncbi:MAG: GNAT family N-acetyltransferase [Clostridiales Family XIII bacterium]|jgi:GNAT superfamily N-acetyltransferase|nr:GNAT family N-acetyltransferase [Clostridiales Family XIII bacterium]
MADGLSFRAAGRGDCELLLGFIRGLAEYEKMLPLVTATPELLSEWMFDRRAAEALFAVVDGREAGFALYFQTFSTFLCEPSLYLEDLFVLPERRGRGIGRAMLAELARIASERGCGRLEWQCLDWNRPSIDFYLSLGAKPVSGWTSYRLTGRALDAMAEDTGGKA